MRALTIRAALLAAISLVAALAGMDAAAAQTATDYDSDGDALIEITNLAQLNAMRYDLDGNGAAAQAHSAKYSAAFPNPASGMGCPTMGGCKGYELQGSLTFDTDGDQDVDARDDYPNWEPIGTLATPFETEFNGNNHSISRLTVRSGAQDAGLFGRLDEATVRDLNLLKADVVSSSVHLHSTAGALAGRIIGGASDKISGVYVTGRVVGTASHIGGLAGYASDRATIKLSCATATVASAAPGTELDPRAGGLIGTVNSAGAMSPADIFGVCAIGDVYAAAARANAGGLIGMATGTDVNIRAAYARGDVYATGGRSVAGGLAGQSYAANLEITASYSAGKVSASDAAGALVGKGSAAFANSYWDATATGFADDMDSDSPEGKTTTQLQELTSATGIYANWQNLNLGETMSVSPWIFGTASQYPVLNWGGLTETDQRIDYDSDNDGLIEITTMAQLNAMRYDLDGNGATAQADSAKYAAAFRSAASGMGCATPPGCKGYELGYDLTFDVNGDGIVDSNDPYPNWTPIGDETNQFAATFNGNGHKIFKMTIVSSADRVGLFGVVGAGGIVKGVGLLDADVSVSGESASARGGAFAGINYGTIESSYATGKVSSKSSNTVGGFVGGNKGWIAACWADVSVSSSGNRGRTGGFAGVNYHKIVASYSRGDVWGRTNRAGGFAGVVGIDADADIRASYSVGKPDGGKYVGGFTPLAYVNSTQNRDVDHDCLWDAETSGTFVSEYLTGGYPVTTAELQSPTSSANRLYHRWDELDLTNDNMDNPVDDPWTYGTASQYPVLVWGDLRAEDQYTDYDADSDGFIEITALAQLDAMRWDLDGDGVVSDADKAKYALAFPYAETAMGCPSTGCNGYELARDLTFDTDGDGDVDSNDAYPNWTPIAGPFAAALKGNGYAISNLKTTSAAPRVGLFGVIAADGSVKDVRLPGADITSTAPSAGVGALAGESAGIIEASYAGGAVSFAGADAANVGGLVGKLSGEIAASWSDASVSASGEGSAVGGLAGKVSGLAGKAASGKITASYARGNATGSAANAKVGGLIGAISGEGSAVSVSYSTGTPTASGTGASAGGLVGSAASTTTFTASYWDTATSGVADDPDSAFPEGRTTAQLQSPTGASGIYVDWDDLDLTVDGVSNAVDDPWDFESGNHYPAIVWGDLRADDQYADYDADDDGLIEITELAHLNAVRYDLDGDGATAQADESAYIAAFSEAKSDMGCPYDMGCAGYELAKNLTFAAPYANWTPIGDDSNPFAAAFEGNGRSLSGLTINSAAMRVGLFGKLDGAAVRNLRLLNANVASTSTDADSAAGALAGAMGGDISDVYVSGTVSGRAKSAGGLAGVALSRATIISSCANARVSSSSAVANAKAGGLLGAADSPNADSPIRIFASCALGSVTASGATARAGGLVGKATGADVIIRASYARGAASALGAGASAAGLVGLSDAGGLEITASYSSGAPTVRNGTARGLVRITPATLARADVEYSYWDATASRVSDDSDSNAPEGKTTTQLQMPISAAGLYANWGAIDLTDDGEINKDDAPWDFGTASQYPVIDWKGLKPADQGR